MASRMMTGQFARTVAPGQWKVFQDTLTEIPKSFMQLFNIIRGANPGGESGSAYVDFHQVSSLGQLAAKPEGDVIQYDNIVEGNNVRATPYAWALGYRCTRELKADGKYGVIDKLTRELAAAAAWVMEVKSHRLLNNAFGTTGGTGHTGAGFDALALISTAHTLLKSGGTRANRLATDVDLSLTGLELMTDLARGWVGHSGQPKPWEWETLVIPYQSAWVAKELLQSELKPYTGNNEVNPLGGEGRKYMIDYYLTDSDSFYLMAPKARHNLYVWIREEPDFEMDDDFDTKDTKASTFLRQASFFGEPDGVAGSAGA